MLPTGELSARITQTLNQKNAPMKTHTQNLFLLPALIVGLGLMPVGRAMAQPFTFWPQVKSTAAARLFRTFLGVVVVAMTLTLTARGQVSFCTQIQTVSSSSISYESGLFTYTDSDASDPNEEHAILPYCGAAASAINSTNAWSASISIHLSPRSLPVAAGSLDASCHAEMGLVVSTSLSGSLGSEAFVFELAQENNTGDGDGPQHRYLS